MTAGLVALMVVITLSCAGWTVWWGVLLRRRGRWGWAVLLWFLAFLLVVEMAFQTVLALSRPWSPPPN